MVLLRLIACALAFGALDAGAYEAAPPHRNQSGTLNLAPRPAVYSVQAVDAYDRIVTVRALDGATTDVYVGEDVYDLAQLKPGDRIRVDFLVPDDTGERPAAATIWPLR